MAGHIVPEEGPDEGSPSKGRRNAIVTYETLARIDSQVSVLVSEFRSIRAEKQDHESRLRLLESTMAGLVAASATRRGDFQWAWQALFTFIHTATVVGALLYTMSKGSH
jgi:hypothetical protein